MGDYTVEDIKDKAANPRTHTATLEKMLEEEKASEQPRSTAIETLEKALADREAGDAGGREGAGDDGDTTSETAGADEGAQPEDHGVAGAVINPGDDLDAALEEHRDDPQGSTVVDAADINTVSDQVTHGTHLKRGPDGQLHQVSQVYTNF
jgi:hypothetical protein